MERIGNSTASTEVYHLKTIITSTIFHSFGTHRQLATLKEYRKRNASVTVYDDLLVAIAATLVLDSFNYGLPFFITIKLPVATVS